MDNFFVRVLSIATEEVEEIELDGFSGDKQTTFCSNVSYHQFIQVINLKLFPSRHLIAQNLQWKH